MPSIKDKAASGGPEIVLARDLAGQPPGKLIEATLSDHDELSPPGQFPEHGTFLPVEVDGREEWWECPGGLARAILEVVDGDEEEIPGLIVGVNQVIRTENGFQFTLQRFSDG